MKIQAALAHSNKAPLSIEEIDLIEPGPNDILVKIVASGLCHTDLTVLNNAPLPWPAVLGHEGAGIVEKVGSNIGKVSVGDAVLMTTASCIVSEKVGWRLSIRPVTTRPVSTSL